MTQEEQGDMFLKLLTAAMLDAAVELKCTQLQCTIQPPGAQPQIVRLVVIPEKMQFDLSQNRKTPS